MENELLNYLVKYSEEIRYRILKILEVFGILFGIFVIFRIQYISLLGHRFLFLFPDPYDNIGAQVLFLLKSHILTANTALLVLKPVDGVMADFYTCMALALIISMPVIVFEVSKFIDPALKNTEKEMLRSIIIPASLLFFAGAFVGIYFIAPILFRIFTRFDIGVGAQVTIGISSFVSFIFMYTIAFGLSFEIPVFMVGLSRFGIVTADTWKKNWRYAVIGSLIYGMIFSPGVTGFTMVVIAIPMIALYFAGIHFAVKAEKKFEAEEVHSNSADQ
ncbi:MAG: twin-arginine translocase subunit TatC [Candidatus Thermoplasmatota archaeon]|nr:twin-arginine translocase subunit TatC [Candidatus Thermoplasmatota archaeon]